MVSEPERDYLNCAAMVGNFRGKVLYMTALALVVFMAGCGAERESEGDEGSAVTVDDAVYSVQFTRLLNANDPEDKAYLIGQPELKGRDIYLGVFVKIRNDGDKPYTPPRNIEVVESGGKKFLPLNASKSAFALSFTEAIPPGGKEPVADSVAASGPADGSLILYKITQSTIQRQPISLKIPARSGESGTIHVDI